MKKRGEIEVSGDEQCSRGEGIGYLEMPFTIGERTYYFKADLVEMLQTWITSSAV